MTFSDEQKQNEFNAFAAYYEQVTKRPHTAQARSLLNQLRTIAVGQYGNGAWQELNRAARVTSNTVEAERKLGKQSGGRSERHSPSPVARLPKPGSERAKRLAERLPQNDRSEAGKVVAGGETAAGLTEKMKRRGKEIAAVGATADEIMVGVATSPNALIMSDEAITSIKDNSPESLESDAQNLNAKDLVEKYGRDLIFETLTNAGENPDALAEKTDRQLANLLKRIAA